MKVLLIPYNASPQVVEIPNAGDSGRLDAMQKLVNGMVECIELYELPNGVPDTEMWANEEAMYVCVDLDENGNLVPQKNAVATILARRHAPGTLLGAGEILGHVFLTGGVDKDGETLGVSEEAIRLAQEVAAHLAREKTFA